MARTSGGDKTQVEQGANQERGGGGDNIEQVKMWRAQENTRALYKVITRPYNNPTYLKWVIAQTFSSTTDMMAWLRKIDDYTKGRIPVPGMPGVHYNDPYQDAEFVTDMQNTLLKEWVELSRDFDSSSKVAMRDYMMGGWKFPYDILNPDFFISWAGEGNLLLLTGEKGSGKSDLSCTMSEIGIAKGYSILGNIELERDVPGYIYCRLFSDMVSTICELKLKGVESITIIDEAGLDFPSYEAATREWKEFDKFAKLTRKFKNNQIFIIQYTTQIPWTLRRHYAGWIHKLDKTDMRFELKAGPYKGFDQTIGKIPRTKMPYKTEHIAGMTIDIEVRDMLNFLDKLPPRSNQFAELKKFVDRYRENASEEITISEKKFLAKRLIELSQNEPDILKVNAKQLARIVDVSERTAQRWTKKKKGEDIAIEEGD